MFKKTISLILAFTLVFMGYHFSVNAGQETYHLTAEELKFENVIDEITKTERTMITGFSDDFNIETLNNLDADSIVLHFPDSPAQGIQKGAFRERLGTKSMKLVLPEGIMFIESEAFRGNANLTEVHLPNTVEHIGRSAFRHCGIETVNFPNVIGPNNYLSGVQNESNPSRQIQLADYAFANNHLTQLDFSKQNNIRGWIWIGRGHVANGIGSGVFMENRIHTLHLPAEAPGRQNMIGELAFAKNAIESLVIPEHIGNIYFDAFRENTALTSLQLQGTRDLQVDRNAFYGCSITGELDVSRIGEMGGYSFAKNKITKVKFGESPLTGYLSFSENPLHSIEYRYNRGNDGGQFSNTELVHVDFSQYGLQHQRTIPGAMFQDAKLRTIYINDRVNRIDSSVFKGNHGWRDNDPRVAVYVRQTQETSPGVWEVTDTFQTDNTLSDSKNHLINPVELKINYVDAQGNPIDIPSSIEGYDVKIKRMVKGKETEIVQHTNELVFKIGDKVSFTPNISGYDYKGEEITVDLSVENLSFRPYESLDFNGETVNVVAPAVELNISLPAVLQKIKTVLKADISVLTRTENGTLVRTPFHESKLAGMNLQVEQLISPDKYGDLVKPSPEMITTYEKMTEEYLKTIPASAITVNGHSLDEAFRGIEFDPSQEIIVHVDATEKYRIDRIYKEAFNQPALDNTLLKEYEAHLNSERIWGPKVKFDYYGDIVEDYGYDDWLGIGYTDENFMFYKEWEENFNYGSPTSHPFFENEVAKFFREKTDYRLPLMVSSLKKEEGQLTLTLRFLLSETDFPVKKPADSTSTGNAGSGSSENPDATAPIDAQDTAPITTTTEPSTPVSDKTQNEEPATEPSVVNENTTTGEVQDNTETTVPSVQGSISSGQNPVIQTPPANGIVELDEDGNWTYIPLGAPKEDKFVISVTDENGEQKEVEIIIDLEDIALGGVSGAVGAVTTLPNTGERTSYEFYFIGTLMLAAGIYIVRRK